MTALSLVSFCCTGSVPITRTSDAMLEFFYFYHDTFPAIIFVVNAHSCFIIAEISTLTFIGGSHTVIWSVRRIYNWNKTVMSVIIYYNGRNIILCSTLPLSGDLSL